MTLRTIRRVGDAAGVRLELAPRMSAAEVTNLLDAGHARLVEIALRLFRENAWDAVVEYTFNHFGDRGSVDILGWHAATATLVIVEVKTRLLDVQELLGTLDRKCRVVPMLVARERAWRASAVGRLLIVEDRVAARRVVKSHANTFDAAIPARTRLVRAWIAAPDGPLAGIAFLSPTTGGRDNRVSAGVQRVRASRQHAG
jgi:hypothetical protein